MKFNILSSAKEVIVNKEGAKAFKLSAEMELYKLLLPGV